MSRIGESGGHLGGIGLMLDISRVCPRCGKRLSSSPTASARHLSGRGCRPTVFAALPEVELIAESEDESPPPLPATQRIRNFERRHPSDSPSTSPASLPPTPSSGPTRLAYVPWLPPPDLGEVF